MNEKEIEKIKKTLKNNQISIFDKYKNKKIMDLAVDNYNTTSDGIIRSIELAKEYFQAERNQKIGGY